MLRVSQTLDLWTTIEKNKIAINIRQLSTDYNHSDDIIMGDTYIIKLIFTKINWCKSETCDTKLWEFAEGRIIDIPARAKPQKLDYRHFSSDNSFV